MAQKRKAKEAFGRPEGQLSAFAAAKLARQSGQISTVGRTSTSEATDLAAAVGTLSYDGNFSGATTPGIASADGAVVLTPPRRAPVVQLSSTDEIEINTVDDECLQIQLGLDKFVTLVGEYDVEVLSGLITIHGAVLRVNSGRQRVYAPSTHALPSIRARQPRTTIQISSVKSGLRKLDSLSPLFRNLWAASDANSSYALLRSTDDDSLQRSLNALIIDKQTESIFSHLSSQVAGVARKPRVIAIGVKASGKSTLNRALCNHLCTSSNAKKCLYLDIDPGQPEFGPTGQLSLVEVTAPILGPPLTHPASSRSQAFKLVRSHTIAAHNFKDNPELYKSCVQDLVRHSDSRCPLIVNSCGWVNGMGATVLVELMSNVAATDILFLEPLDETLIESLQMASRGSTLHRVPRQTPRPSIRTPAESRAMQTMAYFHHRLNTGQGFAKWSGKPVNRLRHWVVSYAGPQSGILAVVSYGQSPSPKFLHEVLDGSVVAVVVLDDTVNEEHGVDYGPDWLSHDFSGQIERTPEDIPYAKPDERGVNRTVHPSMSHCVGLALVRGIDTDNKQLHLVTPLTESQIVEEVQDRGVVLVRGSFDPPEWAYLEDIHQSKDKALGGDRPWVSRREMVGIEGSVWRLRHPPMASSSGQVS